MFRAAEFTFRSMYKLVSFSYKLLAKVLNLHGYKNDKYNLSKHTGMYIQLVKSSVMNHMTLVNYLVSIGSAFEVVMCHVQYCIYN